MERLQLVTLGGKLKNRPLRMGIEFLTEGSIDVEQADGLELSSIKRGEWSLEKVKAEAERLFQLAQEAYVRSSLPL